MPEAIARVSPRILRRVIRRHRAIVGFGLRVPHEESYRIAGADLARVLPGIEGDPVILLRESEPDPDRRLFHERVHLEARKLTPARIREHVHRIGIVEFDEIRRILRHDHLLLPPHDEFEVYSEFAAHYLELLHFDPAALDHFFPAVGRRRDEIEALLGEDFPDRVRPRPRVEIVPPQEDFPALCARLIGSTKDRRLVHDLRVAAHSLETTPYRVDVIEWALSFGRRPVRRPLECLRETVALERVRRAARRVADPADREGLRRAAHELEAKVRGRVRPVLEEAAGELRPANRVERLASAKLVEELLDRVVDRGFFTFGDLRDAIARNAAKLHDLSARDLLLGDALLRIDRKIAAPLEGVYRRGEVYLRWLQKLSSLSFGTAVGRFLTRYLALPFGGAFVILEGLQHMIGPPLEKLARLHLHLLTPVSFAITGLFLLLLMHVGPFRRGVAAVLRGAGRALKSVFFDLPRAVLGWGPIRRLRGSRPWKAFVRFLLAPAIPAVPVALLWGLPWGAAAFGAAWIAVNTAVREAVEEWLLAAWRQVTSNLIPNILRGIVDFFHAAMDLVERGLYRVDELLRFRPGDGMVSIALKGAFGLVWFVFAYVVRLYINLLLEPQVNPVKHFPVVTVAAKIMLPMTITLTQLLRAPLMPLGPILANALAATTVFLLPGFFGFLVWELKENWRLYRANRPRALRPAVVGSHGETIPRLLRPGFHSGTIPKLFAKLRRARRAGRRVAKLEESLLHVEESVRRFLEREFLPFIGGGEVGEVWLTPTRIVVEGREISFEERSGVLVARATAPGHDTAILGLFHKAGADFSGPALDVLAGTRSYDVTEEHLVVWRDGAEVVVPVPEDVRLASRPIPWEEWVSTWEQSPRDGSFSVV